MRSELDIAGDDRGEAGAIDLSGEQLLIPRHSSIDVVNKENEPLDPPKHF